MRFVVLGAGDAERSGSTAVLCSQLIGGGYLLIGSDRPVVDLLLRSARPDCRIPDASLGGDIGRSGYVWPVARARSQTGRPRLTALSLCQNGLMDVTSIADLPLGKVLGVEFDSDGTRSWLISWAERLMALAPSATRGWRSDGNEEVSGTLGAKQHNPTGWKLTSTSNVIPKALQSDRVHQIPYGPLSRPYR